MEKKSIFNEKAYATIEGKKKVKRLTNESYDETAKRADERIEEKSREYIEVYKRAALF